MPEPTTEPSRDLTEPSSANRAAQGGAGLDHIQHLWAPWRFGYIADGPPLDGCPFCVLPDRGPGQDRTSLILHRGEHAYVICNAYPYNPGHLMVVPFAHVDDLTGLSPEASAEVWSLGVRTVAIVKDLLGASGVNLGMNLGTAGGAGIADHVHLHVVPRWTGDTNFISTVGGARVLPRALEEVYDHLAMADWGA